MKCTTNVISVHSGYSDAKDFTERWKCLFNRYWFWKLLKMLWDWRKIIPSSLEFSKWFGVWRHFVSSSIERPFKNSTKWNVSNKGLGVGMQATRCHDILVSKLIFFCQRRLYACYLQEGRFFVLSKQHQNSPQFSDENLTHPLLELFLIKRNIKTSKTVSISCKRNLHRNESRIVVRILFIIPFHPFLPPPTSGFCLQENVAMQIEIIYFYIHTEWTWINHSK